MQCLEVEDELEVAIAALPGADGVAVHGVHVHVDGQQVVAALGAVLEHGVEKELGVDPLALQPALHVRERDHDGVDGLVPDLGPQLVDGQGWWGLRHRGSSALLQVTTGH